MALWWTLRAGAFLCYLGHGAFGVITKTAWVPFFAVAGIDRPTAFRLMPIVGAVDIAIGVATLLQPRAALAAYMVAWAVWTAALRPLTGQPVWEMLERAGNYGVPLALLAVIARAPGWRGWAAPAVMRPLSPPLLRRLRLVLTATVALLLAGHGALALAAKPELVAHAALLAPLHATAVARMLGALELGLAAAILWRPTVGIALVACGWKLATELLFLAAGAPAWEVVERGGSYAAPLALAMVLSLLHAPPERPDAQPGRARGRHRLRPGSARGLNEASIRQPTSS